MRRWLWFLLLLSLGLNVGLGLRVSRDPEEHRVFRRGRGGEQREGRGHADRREGPGNPFSMERFRDLGLSDAQRHRLETLLDEYKGRLAERRKGLRGHRSELRGLLCDPDIDRERIAETRRRHGRLQADLDSLVTEMLLSELEVLTPDQRRRYLERMPWRKFGPPSP